jgi:UDP-N-acetylmuramoyl-L-alanyl-D-glutamate--2,6-diaminopimelate ligase
MENYFESKKKLFTEHLEDNKPAVINSDDQYGRRLIENLSSHDIWSYGIETGARVEGEIINLTAKGGHLKIKSHNCKLDIKTVLIGKHNCYNILGAVATGLALGIPEDEIENGVMLVDRIPGRLETVDSKSPFQVIVDFAHTPDAMEKSLGTLRSLPHNRIIIVFGCGGDRDRTKRPVMGKVAAEMSNYVVITSDNPRSESPEAIISEIVPELKGSNTPYIVEPDRREAIRKAIGMAQPEDIVLISGKGHETYQIIGNKVIPFDDKKVAMEFL